MLNDGLIFGRPDIGVDFIALRYGGSALKDCDEVTVVVVGRLDGLLRNPSLRFTRDAIGRQNNANAPPRCSVLELLGTAEFLL